MITIDKSRCNLCGICLPVCVRRILRPGEKSVEVTDPPLCLSCGHCKAVCPTDAPRFKVGNEEFVPAPKREEIPEASGFFRFLRSRRSLRRYQDRPVEKEKLAKVLEAGRYAPTGANRQACEYTIVSGRKTLDPVCNLAIQVLLARGREINAVLEDHRRRQAPLPEEYAILQNYPAVWERIDQAWKRGEDQLLYRTPALVLIHIKEGVATSAEVDAAIASTHMILMAETLGLGTCYIHFLVWAIGLSPELRILLKIPDDHKVYVDFTIGYPDVEYLRLPARKPAKATWIGEFVE